MTPSILESVYLNVIDIILHRYDITNAIFCRVHVRYAVLNEAPFHVVESGYGGFLLPVDIFLRTACEPRRLRLFYDLQLDSSCSVACVRYEKVVFWNPAEPLRSALRKSGAVSNRCFLVDYGLANL